MQNKTWKLHLDDECHDYDAAPFRVGDSDAFKCETVEQALALVDEFGLPESMSLDHDLGQGPDGMDFLRALYERFPDGPVPTWTIHSQNCQENPNMISYLRSWERSLSL